MSCSYHLRNLEDFYSGISNGNPDKSRKIPKEIPWVARKDLGAWVFEGTPGKSPKKSLGMLLKESLE